MTTAKLRIAKWLRELRRDRRWPQSRLAERLEISQAQLSRIESGNGSLTAEQLLRVLAVFNVGLSGLLGRGKSEDRLQNALARYGATDLLESENVVPAKEHEDLHSVITQALAFSSSPRQIAGLAPVIIRNHKIISLPRLQQEFSRLGYLNRLNWLLENTLHALNAAGKDESVRRLRLRNAKAELKLKNHLQHQTPPPAEDAAGKTEPAEDILDHDIASEKTLEDLRENRSELSRKWAVLTALREEDFIEALRRSHE